MKVNAKLFALVFLLLAAATLLIFFGDGGLLDDEFVKPTTGILESMRGTATAEVPQPGQKAPRQESGFGDWWFDLRFPNWVSA